ncbi:unnamed protein product [Linum trigynum]|uniref:Uncharacterized protein n=1 Tax=Linum trigynum TaxID=586398 RepID=A0AAV2EUP9_9ROSI
MEAEGGFDFFGVRFEDGRWDYGFHSCPLVVPNAIFSRIGQLSFELSPSSSNKWSCRLLFLSNSQMRIMISYHHHHHSKQTKMQLGIAKSRSDFHSLKQSSENPS